MICAASAGALHASTDAATIYRDHYGMPHIFAKSETAGMYALGYATAEDRLVAVLRNYKQSRGELAEIDGEQSLSGDVQVRAFRLADIAVERYPSISRQVRDDLEAYCHGFNLYRNEHSGASPVWAWDIRPTDVVTFAEFINLAFAADNFQQMPGGPQAALADQGKQLDLMNMGSNGFALSASRLSGKKGVIVSADPHLRWDGFFRWYEFQLTCGPLNVAGVTFAGLPYISMGHNGHLAWANTVNAPDLFDIYEEHLRPADHPTEYEYDGKFLPLETRKLDFHVKAADGSERTVSQAVPYTRHGPVLLHRGDLYYAFRKSGIGEVGMLEQVRQQDLAGNCHEYERAISHLQVVMFNHIVGDDQGHIEYVYGGRIPTRPAGYDFHAPVPGWLKATEWGGPMPFSELPKVVDPSGGFLQNCNDAPYYVSPGTALRPVPPNGRYPDWETPASTTPRGIRLTELLRQCAHATAADVQSMATDTLDLTANEHLSEWIKLAGQGDIPEADKPIRQRALAVLGGWNRERLGALPGPLLFDAWRTALDKSVAGASPYTASVLSSSLTAAARMLEERHVPLDLAWGEAHRLQRGAVDLPLDGGGESLVPNTGPLNADGKSVGIRGSSYQMVVELGRGRLHVWSYSPFGVSDNPTSPHFTDQMELSAHRRFRVVPFTLDEVKADAESTKVVRETNRVR